MRLLLLVLLLLSVMRLDAQGTSQPWEQYLNQVMTAEDMESETWQQTYDLLCDLAQHPLDINKVTREDLEALPFLSAQQVEALMAYRYRYGAMKSLAELQLIREIEPPLRRLLACLFYAGEESQKVSRLQHELTGSVRVPCYERQGDTNGYLGYPYRHWLRYQLSKSDQLKLGLVAAQDAGEPFFSNKNQYGYDYYAPYLEMRGRGIVETLVLGRYRVAMGMGLVMNNSFALGKIAILQQLGRTTNTLRAHASRTIGSLQGAGATFNLGCGLRATAFVSYAPMDATLNTDGTARTILTSDYHRTATEMAKKHNLHVLKTGGALRYDAGRYHLGLHALYTHLDRTLSPDLIQLYNYYKPAGADFLNMGVDYGYTGRKWALHGETATDKQGHIATINTISLSMNNGLKVMALQRYYSYQYTSLDAQSYSDGGRVQNESGIYLGVNWQLSPQWQLAAYTDYAYFPWARYGETTSSYSWDQWLQCLHTTGNWKLTARYRLRVKEKTHRVRLSAEYATTSLSARTQLDGGYCAAADSELGAMLSENVAYTCDWLRLNAGVGYFHTDSYTSRVYLYENGPLYTYTMQQFYGEGLRYWLMARAQIGRHLMITAKLGVTDYFDRGQIGSGYQQIAHSAQTDLDLQFRWTL